MTPSDERARLQASDYHGPALLDTHVWLWVLNETSNRMSDPCASLIRRLLAASLVRVSDISVWEVAVKVAKGRLALTPDLGTWMYEAERKPGVDFVPVDRHAFILSAQLPSPPQAEPADRILIAPANLPKYPLVPADRQILAYADAVGGFSVIDARQ